MSEQGQVSQPLRVGRKVSNTPFPTREELMKRNSFPGPDKNKYLNRMWGEMTWILFIIVASYQGPAITTAEFSTQNACETAAKSISAILNKDYSGFDAICVYKATGEPKND